MPDQDAEFTRPQHLEDIAESKSPEQDAKEAYERGKREGFILAGGTAGHFIGNQLAITLGYMEMLAGSKTLEGMNKEMAQEAFNGAVEATKYLKRLSNVKR